MNTAIQYQHSFNGDQTSTEESKLTEIIIPQQKNSGQIIFPLVASISKQKALKPHQEWVTWITDRKPDYKKLKQFGVKIDSLRIIHVNKKSDNRWIIWDALNTGNSHTVIADMTMMNKGDIEQMEVAANNGNCSGIIIRTL